MPVSVDLDQLAAGLHGRRGRMAAGPRLRGLCGLGSPGALGEALFPGEGVATAAAIQARLAEDLFAELLRIKSSLSGPRAAFLGWQAERFRLGNLKLMVRTLAAGGDTPAAALLLLRLPGEPGYGPEMAQAKDLGELAAAIPAGIFRDTFEKAIAAKPAGGAFFYEAELDKAYLAEMSLRAAALRGEGREAACRLCALEADAFNLALAARGRFSYGFEKEELLGLFAAGPCPGRKKFARLLNAAGPAELRQLAAGPAADTGTAEPDAPALEALAWRRYARTAARIFRSSHMGFGAVAAYLALRRVEAANLTTVSEGLRLGLAPEGILGRLVPLSGAGNA